MDRRKRPTILCRLTLIVLLLLLAACSPPSPVRMTQTDDPQKTLGIEIDGIRQTSGGYMLDFRYEVVDAAKSQAIFERSSIPYLIHEESGARFAVPAPAKVGPLRQTTRNPEEGRRYFILFANPGKYMNRGDLVTVVIDDYRFEHLAVE